MSDTDLSVDEHANDNGTEDHRSTSSHSPVHDSDMDEFASDDGSDRLSISDTIDLVNITYSRDATIAAVTSYLQFLTKMYLDEDRILMPPHGGWPEITDEFVKELGKTEEVGDLLRYLPYIKYHNEREVHAAGRCQFADWSAIARSLAHEPNNVGSPLFLTERPWDNIPSHVIGLVNSETYQMFLDTRLGVIYFPGLTVFPGPDTDMNSNRSAQPFPPIRDPVDSYAREEEWDWRSGGGGGLCAWAIPDFFEMLKFHFLELNCVPLSRIRVEDDWDRGTEDQRDDEYSAIFPSIRDIFREHGWPNLVHFEKEKCMDLVEKKVEEYEDSLDE